jgi:hypothetical protein
MRAGILQKLAQKKAKTPTPSKPEIEEIAQAMARRKTPLRREGSPHKLSEF